MPDTPRKISELTAATAIDPANDLLTMVDVSESSLASKNKRLTIAQLLGNLPLGTASAPGVAFVGNPGTGLFSPGANELAISTNGIERARLTSNGYLRLASKGIQFNGDTADANSLDDYEEGTWTPSYSSGANVWSYSQQTGTYIKIGRQAILHFTITATLTTLANLNSLVVIPLPFQANTDAVLKGSCRLGTFLPGFIGTAGPAAVTWASTNSAADGNSFANTTNWPASTAVYHSGYIVMETI